MKYLLPVASWIICVPTYLFFYLHWAFSALGTQGPFPRASEFLFFSAPALIAITGILIRGKESFNWTSFLISTFPWWAFPWIGARRADGNEWIVLAGAGGALFLLCV